MSSSKLSLKTSRLAPAGLAIQYCLLAICLGLMFTRRNAELWQAVPLVGQYQLYANFSNFAISAMFMLAARLFPMLRRQYRTVWLMAGGLIIVNFITEAWVTILNTPDISDAIAGTLGVLFALAGLWLIAKYGTTQPAPAE